MTPIYIHAGSEWDAYRVNPVYANFFKWRVTLMAGWSPWFDVSVDNFPCAKGFYTDSYAISNPSDLATQHPDWILTDKDGNKLFIPFNCSNGACPQYAGDITNPAFISYQINQMKLLIPSKGYRAIFLDDVNLDPKVSNGAGVITLPPNVTAETWAAGFVDYVQQIRKNFLNSTIIHNSVWYFATQYTELVNQQIQAADYINIERGYGDPNFNDASIMQLMEFTDQVHKLNRNVIQMENSQDNLAFKLACFYLTYKPGDLFCCRNMFPDAWNSLLDLNLGSPTEDRVTFTSFDGTVQCSRFFMNGHVIINMTNKTGTVTAPVS